MSISRLGPKLWDAKFHSFQNIENYRNSICKRLIQSINTNWPFITYCFILLIGLLICVKYFMILGHKLSSFLLLSFFNQNLYNFLKRIPFKKCPHGFQPLKINEIIKWTHLDLEVQKKSRFLFRKTGFSIFPVV